MSALGQKQTFAVQKGMSALPLEADIVGPGAFANFLMFKVAEAPGRFLLLNVQNFFPEVFVVD
jgi:hypothetical protein